MAKDGTLTLAGQVSSGGLFPDSLTVRGNVLYVLNAGGPGVSPACATAPNVTGFRVKPDGRLVAIPESTRTIDPGSSPGTFLNCDPGGFPAIQFDCGMNPPAFPRSPAEVAFTPDGEAVVVTVKGTNSIYVFPIGGDKDGTLGTPTIWKATGPYQPTYFGFSFDSDGNLIVAEPFGATATIPAAPASAVSSFAFAGQALEPISADVPNMRGLACWVAVDPLGKHFAYISNNGTSDISAYAIGDDGHLALLNASAGTADHPNDLAVVKDRGKSFLYVLNAGNGTVGAFQIKRDGSLSSLGEFAGLPAGAGAQGLAAY